MQTQGNYRLGVLVLGVTAALACWLLALGAAQPAQAAFPGNNGKIVFWSNRSSDPGLYAISPGGAAAKVPGTSAGDNDPAWSPDGTKVAFRSASASNYEISVMNADGTGRRQLTSTPVAEQEPAWSPDGARIAYVLGGELWVMNADGSGKQQITDNSFPDTSPAWSPDGTKIAFVSTRDGDTDRNVYVMNADGSGSASNLTPYTPGDGPGDPPYQGHDDDPNWSPDGTKIAYVHTYAPNASGVPNIWVMDASGANKTNVQANSSVSGVQPAWSPDGSKIAYVGVASGTNRDIWAMDASGANQGTVEAGGNAAHDVNPDWQNDSVRPTVKKAGPTGNKVRPRADVTATFSEEMDPTTLDGTTFKLVKKGSTKALAASITYSAATARATLDPTKKLRSGATYRATITSGAKDTAGNELVAKSWGFKVR